MLSHTEFMARRRFDRLDGLRAVSILLVFTAHPASHDFWPHLHGQAGVTLFFVLSGFLITTLLLREESRTGRVDFRGFYLRRLFRIYPMFFAVLAGYCVLILVLGLQPQRREVFVENIPYYVLFFPEHAIFFEPAGVSVPFNMSWSIGIEEKFYLLWPALGFVLLAKLPRLRVPVLVAVVLLAAAASFSPWAGSRAVAPYAHIAFGSLAALLLNSSRTFGVTRVLARRPVLAALVAVAVGLQLGTDEILDGGRLFVAHGLLLTAILVGVVASDHREWAWLASRPMVYLGTLSYVLYLIHNFGLNFAEMVVPHAETVPWTFLSTALGIGGSVVVAHVVHRVFEEPMRQVGVRLSRRRPWSGPRTSESVPTERVSESTV